MSKRIGQFDYVRRNEIVGHLGTKYRVIVYGAINSGGLVGPEYNGVAVLDEDEKRVVVEGMAQASSGYYGPTREQIELFKRLVLCDYDEFREIVSSHENYKGGLPAMEREMV